jgi:hypothetical protein
MKSIFGDNGTAPNGIVDYNTCQNITGIDNKKINDISCNVDTNYFKDNAQNCVKKQLCQNKEYAEEIENLQIKHNGADEKFGDINSIYGFSLINVLNIGSGILFLFFLINKYSRNI